MTSTRTGVMTDGWRTLTALMLMAAFGGPARHRAEMPRTLRSRIALANERIRIRTCAARMWAGDRAGIAYSRALHFHLRHAVASLSRRHLRHGRPAARLRTPDPRRLAAGPAGVRRGARRCALPAAGRPQPGRQPPAAAAVDGAGLLLRRGARACRCTARGRAGCRRLRGEGRRHVAAAGAARARRGLCGG